MKIAQKLLLLLGSGLVALMAFGLITFQIQSNNLEFSSMLERIKTANGYSLRALLAQKSLKSDPEQEKVAFASLEEARKILNQVDRDLLGEEAAILERILGILQEFESTLKLYITNQTQIQRHEKLLNQTLQSFLALNQEASHQLEALLLQEKQLGRRANPVLIQMNNLYKEVRSDMLRMVLKFNQDLLLNQDIPGFREDFNLLLEHLQDQEKLIKELLPQVKGGTHLRFAAYLSSTHLSAQESGIKLEELVGENIKINRRLALAEKYISDEVKALTSQEEEHFQQYVRRNQLFSFTLLLGIAGLMIWGGLRLSGQITAPLAQMKDFIQVLTQGKVDQRLEVTNRDEVGEMAQALNHYAQEIADRVELVRQVAGGNLSLRVNCSSEQDALGHSLNRLIEDLRQSIGKMNQTSSHLTQTSGHLALISDQLSTTTSQVSSQTQNVAGASAQMAESISMMASVVEEVSTSIRQISDRAAQISDNSDTVHRRAGETSEITSQAKSMAEDNTKAMEQLNRSVQEIDKITNLIKEISHQTNLLSLNANIEAASAGEAGKGFSVVAYEINDLSAQSADAAEGISNTVRSIQKHSKQVLGNTKNMRDFIFAIDHAAQLIMKQTSEQQEAVQEITRLLVEMSQSSQEAAGGATQMAANSEEVSQRMVEVSQAFLEVTASTQKIHQEAMQLGQIAQEQEEQVRRFSLDQSTPEPA